MYFSKNARIVLTIVVLVVMALFGYRLYVQNKAVSSIKNDFRSFLATLSPEGNSAITKIPIDKVIATTTPPSWERLNALGVSFATPWGSAREALVAEESTSTRKIDFRNGTSVTVNVN